MDKIHIKELLVRCIIGINPEERREKQDVVINITMFADFTQASNSDNIDDAVDYKTIKKKVMEMVVNSNYFLIERLSNQIAQICLENQRVRKVIVSVDKPGALRFARSVGVEITREQV